MNHYFTNDYSKTDEKMIKVIINDEHFKFITDRNTFSKSGLDFGTRSLLENLDLKSIKGDILDLGCGWGPIGIYIKKLTESNVFMSDVNIKALNLSKKNAQINKVDVNVIESNSFENINNKFDYIITNPPIRIGKDKLYEILNSSLNHLKENGKLYFVINKNQGAKSTIKDFSKNYKVEVIKKNKGFFIICIQNR
ncbi:MAG: class I SAM-dependent methyltransferase [Bacilli bacterium]|nr:class I SAM-dependent methyltransferase [Bacilli bacterium]